MSRRACALMLVCLAGPASAAVPERVMSLNLCSDQLLLALLPPSRITSVTFLSRQPYQSYLTEAAYRVGVNYGSAEEVVTQHPDLVIAGLYTTPVTRQLLKQVGIPLLELAPANTFQAVRDTTRAVGHAVAADERAESLIREMDAVLAQLASTAPTHPITIIGWDGGQQVEGEATMFNAIVSAAGAVNIAAGPGIRSRSFSLEQLVFAHPDLLAYGDARVAAPALRTFPLANSAIEVQYLNRVLVYPELLYSCGLPQSAQAALQLRQMMVQVLRDHPRS